MIHVLNLEDVYPVKSYFYIDDKTKSGFLIDPGAEGERILYFLNEKGWKIEKILLTHGHFDHTGAVGFLVERLGIPVLIHNDEKEFMEDGDLNLSANFGKNMKIEDYTIVNDKDKITLQSNPDFFLEVIHTPGHTPGSVVFYNPDDKIAFIGDDLFEHQIGLTHFPGGDLNLLKDSVFTKILALPDETVLYSGHASPITVKEQKKLL